MENSFGDFLKSKRQEKNLTQKELANKLFVTESAVSKWEKDVAHPDITLLPKLSEILGVTEHELITASVDKKTREEKSQAKKWRAFSVSWSLFFYIAYAVALIPCFICNLAIDKTLSWFWIVASALLLAFSFTNLPKLINKHKLIFVPLSMFASLCVLLMTCCIYTKGDWFFVATLPVLLGLVIIFMPIYISKYKIFEKLKKYKEFVLVGIDFVVLNIMLLAIEIYSVSNGYATHGWYIKYALPISSVFYVFLNLLMSIKFIKVNGLLKTSFVLLLTNMFLYLGLPQFFRLYDNPSIRGEMFDDMNIMKADLSVWTSANGMIDRNIHYIIWATLLVVGLGFLVAGLIVHFKRKNKEK